MSDPSGRAPEPPGRKRLPSWLLYVVAGLTVVLFLVVSTGQGGGSALRIPALGLFLLSLVSLALIVRRRIRERPAPRSDRPPRDVLRRAFPLRVAVWGLLLVPLSVVVAGVAGNATGALAAAPFAVVAVVLALVLRLTGRGLVVTIAISALLFLIFLDFGTFHLSHPDSFADFVPVVLRLAGAVVAIVGTAVTRAQWRRGTFAAPNSRRRRVLLAGAAGLVAVAAISGVLTAAERKTVHAAKGAIVVDLRDDTFSPGRLNVHAGRRVTVLARNVDSYSHSFTIDELDVDEYMGPGTERLITFRIPKTASRRRYVLFCTVTGHENMVGTVRVA